MFIALKNCTDVDAIKVMSCKTSNHLQSEMNRIKKCMPT